MHAKRHFMKAATVAGTVLLMFFSAAVSFLSGAVDGELYFEVQMKNGVSPGVTEEEMRGMDMTLAQFLSGKREALRAAEYFNDDEKAHMEDVGDIFDVIRAMAAIALIIGMLLTLPGMLSSGRRELFRGVPIAAAAIFLILPTAVAVWAAVDFRSAFLFMHSLIFTNDLWMMDPATDLMIRLLPERFFSDISDILLMRAALGALAVPLGVGLFSRIPPIGTRR